MPITTVISNEALELSSTVEDVPFLAIQAADELDELCRGRRASLVAVNKLAEILKNSFLTHGNRTVRKNFIDSSNVAVYSRAIDGWNPENQIATIPELVRHATLIVQNLKRSAGTGKKSQLEEMRDFCLALATAAASYRESVDDLKPLHSMKG